MKIKKGQHYAVVVTKRIAHYSTSGVTDFHVSPPLDKAYNRSILEDLSIISVKGEIPAEPGTILILELAGTYDDGIPLWKQVEEEAAEAAPSSND